MSGRELDVLVVGAGVSGLTTAVCLAEAGHSVGVLGAEPPADTTSLAAGALWGTHLVGADGRVPIWADLTRVRLLELPEAAGVHVAPGLVANTKADDDPPDAPHSALAPEYIPCDRAELPPGYAAGWRLAEVLVPMPGYLTYLQRRLAASDGEVLGPRRLGSLAEAAEATSARVVVNCAGSGARELVPDPEVIPVRGQIVVTANPGISDFFVGNGPGPDDLTYIFPHGDTVVLGGTQQHGEASREPDPAMADRILAACAAVEPGLAGARVVAHRVGLRPFRPSVRLEAADLGDGRTVIHNYGHGGAGVSLSWGCAEDATALAGVALT